MYEIEEITDNMSGEGRWYSAVKDMQMFRVSLVDDNGYVYGENELDVNDEELSFEIINAVKEYNEKV